MFIPFIHKKLEILKKKNSKIELPGYSLKGVVVALCYGYLESWNGVESSLGTFSDPVKTFYAKKIFDFLCKLAKIRNSDV